jgi:hypothetical protein
MNTRMMKALPVLAVLLIPTGCEEGARPISIRNACGANLKQIDAAKAQWAQDNHITNLDVAPLTRQLYGPTNYIREALGCPGGGTYRIGTLREHAQCTEAGHTL